MDTSICRLQLYNNICLRWSGELKCQNELNALDNVPSIAGAIFLQLKKTTLVHIQYYSISFVCLYPYN